MSRFIEALAGGGMCLASVAIVSPFVHVAMTLVAIGAVIGFTVAWYLEVWV